RTLLAALVAVLVLAAAGSYVIVRTRSREMTLARLQSDFVTAVSHEFRTPLTALLQFNDLLDDSADLSSATRRDYYQAQRRATERRHRLVDRGRAARPTPSTGWRNRTSTSAAWRRASGSTRGSASMRASWSETCVMISAA